MKANVSPSYKYHIRHFHYLYAREALKGLNGKVLDVGCGNGEITTALATSNKKISIYGCDLDRSRKPRFTIKYMNSEKLTYKSKEFNGVVMFDVLEHVKAPVKSLKEIKRILKVGGTFHIVVPCEAALYTIDGWIKLIFKLNLKKKPIGHINQFRHEEIINMLKKNGFKIKHVYYSYHFLYQFFSFLYYLYLYLAKNGQYQTVGRGKRRVSKFFKLIMEFGLRLIYFESKILKNIKGQTAHITCLNS